MHQHEHGNQGEHGHDHGQGAQGHGHTHGVVDPRLAATSRGLWAVKWSFAGLMATGLAQAAVVALSGSVALLADTVHNFSDALTAVPLAIAFLFARRAPSRRFTYGFGRVEDLAGILVVLTIAVSAAVAFVASVDRLLHPRPIEHVFAVAAAGLVGFAGNEAVAVFRIRVGRQINSAALIADGYHARVDGFTSLAVLAGALAVWAGFPMADPIAGLVISGLIAKVVWDSVIAVFGRVLDGVEPQVVQEMAAEAGRVRGVRAVTDVRARWVGHRLEAEVHLTLPSDRTVSEAHALGVSVQHRIMHALPYVAHVTVHADPEGAAGLAAHRLGPHEHDGLPAHGH